MKENQVHEGPVAGTTICPVVHSSLWCAHLLATLWPFPCTSIPSHCDPLLHHIVVKLTRNCMTIFLGEKAKSDELASDEQNEEGIMVP